MCSSSSQDEKDGSLSQSPSAASLSGKEAAAAAAAAHKASHDDGSDFSRWIADRFRAIVGRV